MKFMRVALPSHDIAGRIIPCFIDAGLPEPRVLWELIVPGSDITHLRWFISTYTTFLPLMERFGTVDPAVGDPETSVRSDCRGGDGGSRSRRNPALRQRLVGQELATLSANDWRLRTAAVPVERRSWIFAWLLARGRLSSVGVSTVE